MMNTRKIILSTSDASVEFEVNPPELTLEFPHDISERTLMGGAYLELGKSGLKKFVIDTFLPQGSSEAIVESLKKWKEGGKQIRVAIDGLIDNEVFLLTDMKLTVKEGDGDMFVYLMFSEYQEFLVEQVESAKVISPVPKTSDGFPVKYKVVKGDSLYKIAKKYYPSGNYWKKIYSENRGVIGKNPNLIYIGQEYNLTSVSAKDKALYG